MLWIFRLPSKFTYFLIGGPIILFIAILTGRFKRFFQGLLVFILPINYSTHFFRRDYLHGAAGLSFSPLDIVLLVLYAIWIYELVISKSGRFHFFPKITIPALSLVGICALSMIPAQDPYIVLFQAISIFKSILLCLYVANHFRSKRDISFVLVLLLGGLFLQCIIAFFQRWTGVSLGLQLFGEYPVMGSIALDYYLITARVGGTIGHSNVLAQYVGMLIPLAFFPLIAEIKPKLKLKLASGLVLICAFIVMILTLSRAGWVCLVGSMTLLLLLVFRVKLISLRTLVSIALMVVIFCVIILSFSGMVRSRLFGDDYGSARARIPADRVALNLIKAYPWLGVGAKNSWRHYNLYLNLEIGRVKVVHNAYLLQAAETGIPGLLLFLWFLGSILLQSLRNLKTKDTFFLSLNIGLLAGMAHLWARWLVDMAYIVDLEIYWVLIGLVAATSQAYLKERSLPTEGGLNHR